MGLLPEGFFLFDVFTVFTELVYFRGCEGVWNTVVDCNAKCEITA
jgi:hypothetical protein